jgi:hypothetical protein
LRLNAAIRSPSAVPVLTFGNPSAPHRLGEIVNWERHLDEAGRMTEATDRKIRLHDSVRGWGLASPKQTNMRLESQKTRDFKNEGGGNGPHH